jgi:excisionase family DNA binding protein
LSTSNPRLRRHNPFFGNTAILSRGAGVLTLAADPLSSQGLKEAMNMNGQILTRAEAASLLRVPERTLDRWRAEGKLKAFYLGRHARFHRSDVEAMFSTTAPKRPTFGRALAAE